MNTKADAGNIITQKGIIIDKKDNAKTLYLKIINQAKKQLIKIMKNINSGKVRSIKQNIKKTTSNNYKKIYTSRTIIMKKRRT